MELHQTAPAAACAAGASSHSGQSHPDKGHGNQGHSVACRKWLEAVLKDLPSAAAKKLGGSCCP